MFTPGNGGLADWWHDISYVNFNNAGSEVHGWYRMSQTTEQLQGLDRSDKTNACIEAARSAPSGALTVPPGAIRYTVTSPGIDAFGWNGGAFMAFDFEVGLAVHEGGHGIGLNHTFSNNPDYRNVDWAAIGEHDDPWDAMSWANSYVATTPFGAAPAALVAPHLDRMGWLPRSRIAVHAANGASEAIYTLAATNHPEASGALLVRVPVKREQGVIMLRVSVDGAPVTVHMDALSGNVVDPNNPARRIATAGIGRLPAMVLVPQLRVPRSRLSKPDRMREAAAPAPAAAPALEK
ncbi:hypothetical protein [Massilia pseudoviolaceinigra]|uniref:hypothetical protein n=1 Tax=Massilia pseudoviolaceinigra TaxID=3057165 RepID=UPI002796B191|nr:hypothetical protein [Massilia sp. CCM 9206]MDQ1920249.1 hypothetical protein [Massilia sp. CCM 9206]